MDGPFVLGTEPRHIIISHTLRHKYLFNVNMHQRKAYIQQQKNIRVDNLSNSILLTLSLIFAVFVLLCNWTSHEIRLIFTAPLYIIPFFYVGGTVRYVILVYIAVRAACSMTCRVANNKKRNIYKMSSEYIRYDYLSLSCVLEWLVNV